MFLYAVDRILTFVALKADTVTSRWSWRLGRCLRSLAVTLNEAIWQVGTRLGWKAVTANFLQDCLRTGVKKAPRYPVMSPEHVTERAEQLLQGVCLLDDGTTLALQELSWRTDPFGDAQSSPRWRFHAFLWVRELLEAHRLSGQQAYRVRAEDLVEKWVAECLYTEKGEYIWDDHATALRAIVLCQLWTACREAGFASLSFATDLLAAIIRHAEKLAQPSFYRRTHNHGVTQAHALLAIGLLFPHPSSKRWVELGRSRLETQMAENVSPEGFHREHSPSYQVEVLRQFYDAYKLAQAYELKFSHAFAESLVKMARSAAYLVKPNGKLSALGDTCASSPLTIGEGDLSDWPGSTNEYLYSITKGAKGVSPVASSGLYVDGGYACFRSGWGQTEPFEDERFLLLRLATFDTAHIHRDVFSFELYGYGNDLIVDSGGPYAYGDPLRKFFQSTAAHNTIVIHGLDQNIGEAQILHWDIARDYDLLEAEFRGYPGVTHRRTIIFVKPDYFIIIDQLVSSEGQRFSQLFHLNPDLNASLGDRASITTTHRAGGSTLQIHPLSGGVEARLYRGSLSPLQGWLCLGERHKVSNEVVEYSQTGKRVVFATLLMPQRSEVFVPVEGHFDGEVSEKGKRILVTMGSRQDEIRYGLGGSLSVSSSGA